MYANNKGGNTPALIHASAFTGYGIVVFMLFEINPNDKKPHPHGQGFHAL